MKTTFTSLLACLLLLAATPMQAQDYTQQAQEYFGNRLTSNSMMALIAASLPTLEECQVVFKGIHANTYYGTIEEMKAQFGTEKRADETFAAINIEVFSTQDIELKKGNYAGGMQKLLDKLQPYVIFYKVTQLRTADAENGMAYQYWVKINDRWVFFPKPYRAFK